MKPRLHVVKQPNLDSSCKSIVGARKTAADNLAVSVKHSRQNTS